MKFTWLSDRRRPAGAGVYAQDRTERETSGAMKYASTFKARSKTCPKVTLEIARISFGRRIELMRKIRELAARAEFLEAGGTPKEKMEASLLESEVERTYIEWGLTGVEGLVVDGRAATPESLIQSGPEALCREALALIKAECGLSEAERKN
ncbi:MAG: hypothetical protein LLG20_01040 [Acidobacteriales bacterium]|nr:hypothetical protein [Terriglobales bacterium]